MEVTDFLKGKIIYDEHGQNIYCVMDSNGHCQPILDVRGWGAIQNLFKNRDGSIRMDEAQEFQDKMGMFLAKTIDEALNGLKEKQ